MGMRVHHLQERPHTAGFLSSHIQNPSPSSSNHQDSGSTSLSFLLYNHSQHWKPTEGRKKGKNKFSVLFFSPKNKKKLHCSALKPTFVCMEKQFRQVSTVSLQNSLLQNSSLLSLTFKLIYMNICCVLRIQSIQTILALVSHEIKLSKRNLGIQLTLLYSLLTYIWNGLSSPNLN